MSLHQINIPSGAHTDFHRAALLRVQAKPEVSVTETLSFFCILIWHKALFPGGFQSHLWSLTVLSSIHPIIFLRRRHFFKTFAQKKNLLTSLFSSKLLEKQENKTEQNPQAQLFNTNGASTQQVCSL